MAQGKPSKPPSLHEQSPARPARDENSALDIGEALRAAYESAVNEDIPPEMLDLLSKLR